MNWKIIVAVIIGALLLYALAKPTPPSKRAYNPTLDAEVAKAIERNMELRKKQQRIDDWYEQQIEKNAQEALDRGYRR